MPYSYITVDDEKATHILIDYFLKDNPEFVKKEDFFNPLEALTYLKENDCDLIFLDIEMPELNGLDFVEKVNSDAFIVIITAYSQQYAVSGYKYIDKGVIDFLEKPLEEIRLTESLNRFLKLIKEKTNNAEQPVLNLDKSIHVNFRDKLISLPLHEILYLKVSGNYVSFYTESGNRYELYCSLEEAMKRLPQELYCQIHRQYVVMLSKVKNYSENAVSLGTYANGEEIVLPLSTRRKEFFLQKIKR